MRSAQTSTSFTDDGVPQKMCPRCSKLLPVTEFGVNRARALIDGLNCYCKTCVNEMVTARRKRLKEKAAIQPGCREALTLKHRIVEAVESGARTQTEIALAIGGFSPELRVALDSGSLRTRLLKDECGVRLTQSELRWQALLITDELGNALASLLLTRGIRSTTTENGARVYLPKLKIIGGSRTPQMSLFQLTNQFGPKVRGLSAHRGAAEKREAPAGLEPPACSRVA
jgi:hypothetical protein